MLVCENWLLPYLFFQLTIELGPPDPKKYCQMLSMINIMGGRMASFPGGVLLKAKETGEVIGAIGMWNKGLFRTIKLILFCLFKIKFGGKFTLLLNITHFVLRLLCFSQVCPERQVMKMNCVRWQALESFQILFNVFLNRNRKKWSFLFSTHRSFFLFLKTFHVSEKWF